MLKTYLAFVQNTIEPMISRCEGLIRLAEAKGFPLNKDAISEWLEKAFLGHILSEVLRGIIQIIIASIVCYTAYRIAWTT